MLVTNSLLVDLIVVLSTIVLTFIAYIKWTYTRWSRAGVDHVEPTFPFGNFWQTAREKITFGEEVEKYYFQLKAKGAKHAGVYFFLAPMYVPIDPEIVKHIMQVDFGHFVDRGAFYNEKKDPLSLHLFSIEGTKWKNLRAKLSPTFTSGKMKMMFPLVVKTSQELTGVLDAYSKNEPAEFKDILARLTTDIIGTCAFGLDCNSLRDPDTEFRSQGRKFFQSSGTQKLIQFMCFVFPDVMKFFGARFTPKSMEDFFMGVVRDTVKYREENNVKRNDFMQLLIQLKNVGTVGDDDEQVKSSSIVKLTDIEVAAQAFVFFLAGFETSSTTMSFCLYEVARNKEIQDKMRAEITSVLGKHNGEFTYEAMMDMRYMDNVINETLRKYPPLSNMSRICTKEYKIPNSNVILEKGDRVLIPVQAMQHDPEHYPNPELFDPDRFTEENKRKRHPFTFLPFGEGPRICIGLRFGLMQTKVGLTILLKNYILKLNSKTQVPLVMDTKALMNSAAGGIWMNLEKIS